MFGKFNTHSAQWHNQIFVSCICFVFSRHFFFSTFHPYRMCMFLANRTFVRLFHAVTEKSLLITMNRNKRNELKHSWPKKKKKNTSRYKKIRQKSNYSTQKFLLTRTNPFLQSAHRVSMWRRNTLSSSVYTKTNVDLSASPSPSPSRTPTRLNCDKEMSNIFVLPRLRVQCPCSCGR